MAAELGKLSQLIRETGNTSSFRILKITSDALLDKEYIPFSVNQEEGKEAEDWQPDTLASIADRLEIQNYKTGAIFIRGLNKAFNDSGMLTDETQAELIAKAS